MLYGLEGCKRRINHAIDLRELYELWFLDLGPRTVVAWYHSACLN